MTDQSPTQKNHWHFFTSEFPPQKGGVGLYANGLAQALYTEGHQVTVYSGMLAKKQINVNLTHTVEFPVNRNIKNWDPNYLDTEIKASSKGNKHKLFFHLSSKMNLQTNPNLISNWFEKKKSDGFEIWVMIHELHPKFKLKHIRKWLKYKKSLKAFIKHADHVLVTNNLWSDRLAKITKSKQKLTFVPVSTTIPVTADPQNSFNLKKSFIERDDQIIIGSFGSFNDPKILFEYDQVMPKILRNNPDVIWLSLGRESEDFCKHFKKVHPEVADQIAYTGELNLEALSAHISACDILFQPYPDGVSTKRSSLMAGLAHGKPIVTSYGKNTGEIWNQEQILLMGDTKHPESMYILLDQLLQDKDLQLRLSQKSSQFYIEHFSLQHTVSLIAKLQS